jgi:hypothetical protein
LVDEDFELVKQIFTIVESGIVHGYDAFLYKVEMGPGCMESELSVQNNGVVVNDAETDFDGFTLFELATQLRENAVRRGEDWRFFAMSYIRGGEVKTNFKY